MPAFIIVDLNTKIELYAVGGASGVLKVAPSETTQNIMAIKENNILDITLYGWCRALILTDDIVEEV